jgi:hypothetical protein
VEACSGDFCHDWIATCANDPDPIGTGDCCYNSDNQCYVGRTICDWLCAGHGAVVTCDFLGTFDARGILVDAGGD